MGILNVTPDSFYDGGRYLDEQSIYARVKKMLDEGADIIDVGAQSTRPGAQLISEQEELKRLTLALELIRERFGSDVIVSVDTFRPKIADFVLEHFNVQMINDIMGGGKDFEIYEVVAKWQVPYVLMHIKGEPRTMQNNPQYENVVQELVLYFAERLRLLRQMHVNDVIIDPGFGFGKTLEHNYQLLGALDYFKKLFDEPLLVGMSRKSMIYKLLEIDPDQALNGTTVVNTVALLKGADILRVHDVKPAKEAVRIIEELKKSVN
jgi:dihydropteroate synthase